MFEDPDTVGDTEWDADSFGSVADAESDLGGMHLIGFSELMDRNVVVGSRITKYIIDRHEGDDDVGPMLATNKQKYVGYQTFATPLRDDYFNRPIRSARLLHKGAPRYDDLMQYHARRVAGDPKHSFHGDPGWVANGKGLREAGILTKLYFRT